MNNFNILAVCLILLGSVAVLHTLEISDIKDIEHNSLMYCEMVETYRETNGEFGWPDYKKQYSTLCK